MIALVHVHVVGCSPLFAVVDGEDFDRVKHIRWAARPAKRIDEAGKLVNTLVPIFDTDRAGGVRIQTLLPRLVMGAKHGQKVHQKNGNGLDCRKSNLEIRQA
jgi:hypothetical protein